MKSFTPSGDCKSFHAGMHTPREPGTIEAGHGTLFVLVRNCFGEVFMKSHRGESVKRLIVTATLVLVFVLQFSSWLIGGQGITPGTLPNQQPVPPAKGSISGSVVKAANGEALAGAQIMLTRVGNAPNAVTIETSATPGGRGANVAPPNQQAQQRQDPVIIPIVKTDDQGKFVVSEIPAGTYRVSATRNGYAQQQFGQRSFGRPGTVINVRAGQQVQDIAFRLTPAATIAGRVIDPNGEPLPGVTVQALRSTYDATGKRQLQPVGNAKTNDLGEYRLYWMNPGRYFVNANAAPQGLEALTALSSRAAAAQTPSSPEEAQLMAQSQAMLGPGKNPNEETDPGFVTTYYPNTPDASRAAAVELQPGAEVRGIDFTLTRDRKVHIRGRLVDASTGKAPQMGQVSVSSRDSSSAIDILGALGGALQGNTYDSTTGEFEIKEVSSGRYWLQVMSQSTPPQPAGARGAAPTNAGDAPPSVSSLNTTQIPVDVYGSDIENLTVTLTAGVNIPGRIQVEGTQPANSNPNQNQNPYGAFAVTLNSSAGGGPSLLTLLGGLGAGRPAADGTFSLQRIAPGDYKLAVSGLGPNMYIKEARLDQNDILAGMKIGDSINGTLEVLISRNGGVLDGTIIDATSKPVSGIQAVLIPDTQRDRRELYKTGITDQNGRISLLGLTPGDYRLFAWEDIEPFSYFDPEVLRQYEQQGKLVHVKESATEQVEMKIIPASTP
jgi:hypothetical protein